MNADPPRLWFQVRIGEGHLGPGKAQLLALIRDTGSLSEAARRMGMSYRRAWTLMEAINALTDAPAVETERGGPGGGGSRLTPRGEALLAAYAELRATLDVAAAPTLAHIAVLADRSRRGED
ncbi:winged helix-turn-helix domain-containing protein [Brevundimonas aurifodinae]|uniref:LysR family transcriptional regulator n=2 Tax=Brevundimonas TaxID=41275 RepID=A0ABV1NR13_9CAUL|nr:MAG: LysR family transcriptional regulator [Brevundimonas sp. 12-68-7]OYX33111.1 MAG: LysR family transcriptional regulator [Brevundimonas subvibrioides]